MLDYRVVFKSETNVFSPGSQFNGYVSLNTDGKTRARKIDLKIIGHAETRWTETTTTTRSDGCTEHHETRYGCQENYIYEYAILWRSIDGSNNLPAGKYKFPFTVRIPNNAPASFHGEYGDVKYFVRTNIDIPWAFDVERIASFIVAAVIDLNANERLSRQAYTGATKSISPWCSCKSNPIILKVTLPKTGYICGEKLSISVNLVNKTTLKMESVEISIIKYILFLGNRNCHPPLPHGDADSKNWETTQFYHHFQPPVSDTTSVYTFTVPMMAPSFLECSIIRISYCIFVKVHTDAVFSSGPQVRIPIVIGTVPIIKEQNAISPTKK